MKNIKIFILGAPKVGKTSLIHQIVFGPVWTEQKNPLPTIEDVYFTSLDTAQLGQSGDKNNIVRDDRILFFDVAGIKANIDIESLRSYIAYADEFVLVYSIDDRSTFNLVDTIKKLIDQTKGKHDHRIVVLGNKVDLDSQRQVDFDEALIWAKRENIKLFEVTSFERVTLLDFTRYLTAQLSATQTHTTSSFKLSIKTTFPCGDRIPIVDEEQEHDDGGESCSHERPKYEASSEPSCRGQVLRLQNQLQNSLVEHQAKAVGLCPIRRAIYDQCFDELIRQVTVGCIEQGLLLFQVRNELRMTIGIYRRAYESAIDYGLSKALEAGLEVEENRAKINQLEAALLSDGGYGGSLAGPQHSMAAPVTFKDKIEQAHSLKEYYESELAKRDEIIIQQRSVIKALTQN